MAIWQYQFYLVKKDFKKTDSEPVFNRINQNSLNDISLILPLSESWSEDISIYGDIDSTCIEFFRDNNILQNVSIRLDLRNLNVDLLTEILQFIQLNEANLYDYSNKIIVKPTLESIITSIKNSKAYQFCENPTEFFKILK